MPDRLYCTLNDVIDDLEQAGVKAWKESAVVDKIHAASDWISQNLGDFIPVTASKALDGPGGIDLTVPPLLAITSITHDGDTLTAADYILYPINRWWENGPYTRLRVDPDAANLSHWTYEEEVIAIAGRWGLYEESRATGATVATQDSSSTSLVANSGAALSPGMALLIDSEQELIEATGAASDSTANTAEAVDASEEEIDVSDGTLVYIGEVIRVNFEQMKIRDIKTNTLLVERGWNGTKRTTHDTAADVYVYRTFTVKRGANGTTAATHSTDTIYRYVMPYDVNYLCRQMASLMLKKAQSGYAGKVGSVELGEVFYYQEFPKDVLERVKRVYGAPRRFGA